MSLLIDLILVGLILIVAYISSKRGFVRTVIEIVGFVIIILISNSASTPIAEKVYDTKIEPVFIKAVDNYENKGSENVIDDFWNGIPKIIRNEAEYFNFGKEDLKKAYEDYAEKGVEDATAATSKNIIKPIVVKILSSVISLILFLVLSFVVRLLAGILNSFAKKLPVIGKLNNKLGFCVGILKGIVFASVFSVILLFITSLFKDGIWIFKPDSVNNSFIIKTVSRFLPENGIFSYLHK